MSAKILIVTDAWHPQVNGVVRTIDTVRSHLSQFGHDVTMITPDQFFSVPCPTYPDISLGLNIWPKLGRMIDRLQPEYIFLPTEGPLGVAARLHCKSRKLHFTTNYNTKFPQYIRLRFGIPEKWTYGWLRWFHAPADSLLVTTTSMQDELAEQGFKNLRIWSRGVDADLFRPSSEPVFDGLERPIWLYVGRIAVEKNLDAFLSMSIEGTKVLVGAGPSLGELKRKYPDAVFVGEKHGEELARHYAAADVFVFPSKTDTFGLVMIEALASGTPVAAYPVTGPVDVITSDKVGVLDADLRQAALGALSLSSGDCREFALGFSWENCAHALEQYLVSNRWN